MKFRKKIPEIEAVKWDGSIETVNKIVNLASGHELEVVMSADHSFIKVGDNKAMVGEWMAKKSSANAYFSFFVLSDEEFAANYEAI